MKKALIALSAMLAVSTAMVVITAEDGNTPHLLGMRKCTWGPSYWCENIKTAAGCNATKHCIKTTWTKMEVPEDNDSVCTVCKDMVQQARDQLESNQTLQDLKDVFEGSCKLIHVKPIIKECITLVDQFIPELVETLASQMNPSVVCSVAGLCNSAHIDKLLLEYGDSESKMEKLKSRSLENDELEPDECSKCYTVAAHMEHKLSNTPPDQMLQQMLNLCGDLGTFTDACSATILTYFDTIYAHLKQNFNVQNVCHLSGQCSAKFHKHEGDNDTAPKVEIRPLSSVGVVDVGDDLPCKLCEQLVGHLRDLLVANTTEAEFQQVLDGLCKQTKSFSTECRAIVDEYYPQIYEYLTKGLDSNLICEMSGICPKRGKLLQNTAIWPLIPENAANIGIRIFKEGKKNAEIEKGEELTKSEVEAMQLPIERTVPFPTLQPVGGKQSCALCEYLLHYVQESLTNPVTEDKVKKVLGNLCNKLPESLTGECSEFVDTYGDAVVAILAQEIDPSQVCPMLRMCPSEELLKLLQTVPNEFVLETEKVENKPSCPLCLLAVTQIYNVIKDDKTEANIEKELDKLCTHLPSSLTDECKDLVKGYSKELVELLIADLTPQEVCVYIKLCDATKNPGPKDFFVTDEDGEILTNEIPEYSPASPQKPVKLDTDVGCVICEFAMQYVDKALSNKNEKDRIEKIVHGVCNHLPKTISKECNDFVDKYADVVIEILSQDVSPKQVCSMMGLCKDTKIMKENIAECSLCRAIISAIDTYLNDPKFDYDIVETVSEVCKRLPATVQPKCEKLIKVYGPSIINILKSNTDNENICKKIALCPSNDIAIKGSRERRSYQRDRIHRCTWGAAYWCSSNETAVECRALEHCQENVWKAEFAPNKQIALAEVKREV